mgnify:CR=1 FL=1
MRKMKKVLSVLATVVMVAAALTACGGNGKSGSATDKKDTNGDGEVKVGIVSMIENGAFMDMKEGIVAELKAQGYEDSQIDYKCAAGDASALSTIVTNMTDGTYDMIFSIATPPTQALVNTETDTPVFFCAVSAPTAAGILTDMDKPDKNATGTSNAIPVSKIIDLAQATTPVKKIGLIYSGNEDNATNTVKQCEEYLKSINVEYVEKTAASSNDVETATNALIAEGAEAIFVPNDSIIQDGADLTPGLANKICIPAATKVCCNFPETLKHLPENKAVLTGSPIRQELFSGKKEEGLRLCGFDDSKPVLLVMGGSLGAVAINNAIRENLDELLKQFQIIHLCGRGHYDTSLDGKNGYKQFEYAKKELTHLFAATDLIISRAGANAICELLALKKPNILIPLPASQSRGDQLLNAASFEKSGYSYVLQEEELTSNTLLKAVQYVYDEREEYIQTLKESKLNRAIPIIMDLITKYSK